MEAKKVLLPKDARIKKEQTSKKKKEEEKKKRTIIEAPKVSSAMFFKHNTALGPPYRILVDTNFINFSIQNKIEIVKGMMDCLFAKCIPCILEAVIAELEKLGPKFRLALRLAKDPRFEVIPTETTYADDELVKLVSQHKCYIVATCDRDLKRRIRKVPGVPIMSIKNRRYVIERMPEALGANT
uniref:PIN domain-containing protein n=1 Tax=Arcella intermedia TaxID=1963864 RepID=A0A6B2LK12_9EUKA